MAAGPTGAGAARVPARARSATLAGEGTLLLATVAKGGGLALTLAVRLRSRSWRRRPGVRVRTPAFEVEIADGIVVMRADAAGRRGLRRGGQREARRRGPPARDAKRGEYWREVAQARPLASQPLAPKAVRRRAAAQLPRSPAGAGGEAKIEAGPRRRPRDHLRGSRAVARRARPRGVREAVREPFARPRLSQGGRAASSRAIRRGTGCCIRKSTLPKPAPVK